MAGARPRACSKSEGLGSDGQTLHGIESVVIWQLGENWRDLFKIDAVFVIFRIEKYTNKTKGIPDANACLKV